MPRHGTEDIVTNQEELYEEFFEKRNVTRITHYRPPNLPPITVQIASEFTRQRHVWKLGDRYYSLASKYYGDPKLWWTIAWFNGKPTEATLKQGDVLYIPLEVQRLLTYSRMGSI